jgi:hypothetical protein
VTVAATAGNKPDTIDITGSVHYHEYRRSTQSGLGFSSDRDITFTGSVTYEATDQEEPNWGPSRAYCHGTVAFSASGENMDGVLSGSLTSEGRTYDL